MTVLITLTVAGTDSGPYDLYSDLDGFTVPFETGVSKVSLTSGYSTALVPDFTNIVRVQSTGNCVNYLDITLTHTTTTTTTPTPTTTTTTTPTPTTTTTTTPAPTTTTTTTAAPITDSVLLGYSTVSGPDACADEPLTPVTRYLPTGQAFLTTSVLYQDSGATIPAQAGYYSDGAKWRQWDEVSFIAEDFC